MGAVIAAIPALFGGGTAAAGTTASLASLVAASTAGGTATAAAGAIAGTAAAGGIGLGSILTSGGILLGGASALAAGNANKNAAEQAAEAARQSNRINEETQRRQFAAEESANIARIAAGGGRISGSPLNVLIDNAFNFDRDLSIQRFNTEVQARQYINQGRVSQAQGVSQFTGSLFSAGGSYLTDRKQSKLISRLLGDE